MNKLAKSYLILTAVLMSFAPISGNAAPTLFGVIGGQFQSPDFAGSLVKIDQVTGASEVVGTPFLDPRTGITGLVVDDVGRLIASTSEDGGPPRLIEIDPTTGEQLA